MDSIFFFVRVTPSYMWTQNLVNEKIVFDKIIWYCVSCARIWSQIYDRDNTSRDNKENRIFSKKRKIKNEGDLPLW